MHTAKRAVSFDTACKGAIAPLCSQHLPDNQRNTPPPHNSSNFRIRAILNAIYPSLTTIMAHSSTEVIKPRLKSCGYKVSCYQIFIMLYGEVDYVFCTPIYIMVRTCETISTASAQTRRCAYRKVCDTAAVALHPSYPHTPIRPVPYRY